MRAVVCRVERASVAVGGEMVGRIGPGLLAYIGVVRGDTEDQAAWLARKLCGLRVFPDEQGRMNRSVQQISRTDPAGETTGGLLLIPNFTLAGRTRKGTRPSFTDAADPAEAEPLFNELAQRCRDQVETAAGVFGADMRIDARFDGPVTLVIDTPE